MADFLLSHPTPARNNFTGAVGCRFTVNTANIAVTRLGRFYDSNSSNNHQITLWISTNTSTPLAQATVLASSPSDANGYKWVNLATPVILTTGNTYAIAIDEVLNGDKWPDQFVPTIDSKFAIAQAAFTSTPGAYPASNGNSGQTYSTPNMEDVNQFLSAGNWGYLGVDSMAQTDAAQEGLYTTGGALIINVQLSDNLNHPWADAFVRSLPGQLSLSDSLNNWADALALSNIAQGAQVSQVVTEVMMSPTNTVVEVSQVVVEVMMPKAFNQPHISVSC